MGQALARIFHEYASIYLVAGMIAGTVAFTLKDNLYQARRLFRAFFVKLAGPISVLSSEEADSPNR